MSTQRKETLYKTAFARISCAEFKAGECVRISHYSHTNGKDYYLITATERGPARQEVVYPAHHLDQFCL